MSERRIKKGWMNLKVTKVIEETWDTKTFLLEDLEESGRTWDYIAGQYLTFRYDSVGEKPLVRSYTMSSSPCQTKNCAVTVKRVQGGLVSNWMCDTIEVGTVLRARGPIGKFVYDSTIDRSHLLMVAAGSGVTPFVSIMREFADKIGTSGAPSAMTLLVSYRSRQDLILWEDLLRISRAKNCKVVTTLSRDESAPSDFLKGRIDQKMLESVFSGNYENTTVMTCGPEAMMQMVKQYGLGRGMIESQIKTESFES